jgi:hypothetical protein
MWSTAKHICNFQYPNIKTKADFIDVDCGMYIPEACPFCRRVREALTELDLSAEVYPCPKGSIRHREFVRSVGGKEQFVESYLTSFQA